MNIKDFEVPLEDRAAFIKFIAFLAQVDNEVTIEEKQALDDMIYVWQLDEDSIKQIYGILENGTDIKQLSLEFKNPKSGYLLIQELVTLSHLDGKYSSDEKQAVRQIAEAFKITEKRIGDIESWVLDGISWRNKGLKLIKPEEEK